MAVLMMQTSRLSRDKILSFKFINHVKIHTSSLHRLGQNTKELDISEATESASYQDEEGRTMELDMIMQKRNKSRLYPQHQNIIHERPPYSESFIPYHDTIKYKRRLFGRYGLKSGIDPGTLWPTKNELQEIIEYEKVAHPDHLHHMVARHKLKLEAEMVERKKREKEVNLKFAKLEQWKAEVEQRTQKKLMEVQATKERKERLVEEVRRYFGFKVDPRDERFKEMLEQKEKEEAKKAKAEKKKAKQAKLLAKLVGSESVAPAQTQATSPNK